VSLVSSANALPELLPVHPVHKPAEFCLSVRKMGTTETHEKIGKMLDLLGFMAYPASNQ
jgi:ABC-type proline/glycine betaine transport system ATPase subunit